jgi:peroxiredoxin Q/BCP
MFGKTFMGIQRSTFIIDPRGKIIKVWENVVPKGHAQEVYNYLKTKMANLKSGN